MGIKAIKPFLRWAWGKSWLIKHIDSLLPKWGFRNYHEPFLGWWAIFLNIERPHSSFLSDANSQLIATYQAVRDYPGEIIEELNIYHNTEEFYYQMRDATFSDEIKNAARFIYLNQTSFNWIYRVNLQGKYNVPFWFRKKPFLDQDAILKVSHSLKWSVLSSGDFENIKEHLQKWDLVFLDPPYTVSHNTNWFIKYNQKLFSLEDQYRLSSLIDFIKDKGAYYILTNAAHIKIKEIFDKGDSILELDRASLIWGTNAKRGKITEYIFTNTL